MEAFGYSLHDGKKGSGAAALGAEAVLGWMGGEVGVEGEEQTFKDFGSRGEEGDGTIGGALVKMGL